LFLLPIVDPVVGLIAPNSFLHTDLVLGLDLIPKLLTSASLLVPAVIGVGWHFGCIHCGPVSNGYEKPPQHEDLTLSFGADKDI
jgi:hypothetical protein